MKKEDIKYKYINTRTTPIQEYEDINLPITLDFPKAREIRNDKDLEYIGPVDDGWSSIYKLHDKYYKITEGLPEYEGNIYMTEVELL